MDIGNRFVNLPLVRLAIRDQRDLGPGRNAFCAEITVYRDGFKLVRLHSGLGGGETAREALQSARRNLAERRAD
jgi:hypothetical protein